MTIRDHLKEDRKNAVHLNLELFFGLTLMVLIWPLARWTTSFYPKEISWLTIIEFIQFATVFLITLSTTDQLQVKAVAWAMERPPLRNFTKWYQNKALVPFDVGDRVVDVLTPDTPFIQSFTVLKIENGSVAFKCTKSLAVQHDPVDIIFNKYKKVA